MNDIQHEPGCSGGHVPEVSCLWVMSQREAAMEDIWYCHESGHYHSFNEESDYCLYGCGQSRTDLESSL
jgi:hypothetical protein